MASTSADAVPGTVLSEQVIPPKEFLGVVMRVV
jgi:hypothetical protein